MILFLDDERANNLEYIEELKLSGFDVEYRKDVGVAYNFLKENIKEVKLLILDIMMPPGALLKDEETNGGLRSGVRFFELVRQIAPDLPVLVLTNVTDPSVQKRFEKEPLCGFVRKEKCFPHELKDWVEKFL